MSRERTGQPDVRPTVCKLQADRGRAIRIGYEHGDTVDHLLRRGDGVVVEELLAVAVLQVRVPPRLLVVGKKLERVQEAERIILRPTVQLVTADMAGGR